MVNQPNANYLPVRVAFVEAVIYRDGSRAGLWGVIVQNWTLGGHKCLFHVKSFLKLLFAIGSTAVWGAMAHLDPSLVIYSYK